MKKFTKKLMGTLITGAITVASFTSAFAATDVTRINSVNVNGSYVNTIVSQDNSSIKAKGGNVKVTDLTNKAIINSVVGTGVLTGNSIINAAGKNVEIISADTFTVDSSVADTLINDVKSKIKTIQRWFRQ